MKQPLKILSIDDEEDIRFALNAIFHYQDWVSLMAPNVPQGLELFRQHRPDIVLIDYHLPIINGIEGVRRLRQISPETPIIVFTIDESQNVANQFLEAGASDFALKPIKVPDLISRINLHVRLLESQKQIAPLPVEVKGIGPSTLGLITDYLRGVAEYQTANQIAEGTGLAFQTTYRYLQHMVVNQLLDVRNSYGKVGRPKQGYLLKKAGMVGESQA